MDKEETCAVCMERLYLPQELPCGHRYCYLCLKGIAAKSSGYCPLCRRDIPDEAITTPKLESVELVDLQWVYESKGGGKWWYYDETTNSILDKAYLEYEADSSKDEIEVVIAGFYYTVSFSSMDQTSSSGVKRKIKRADVADMVKGVAGVPLK